MDHWHSQWIFHGSKKAKILLKVNGKVYKATTNKKGKVVYKIRNLKKAGMYKSVIKFSGSKVYKAATRHVKLVVKK